MAIGKPLNQTNQFNLQYNITLDMSGWDETTIQVVSPMSGIIFVYGTNDSGAQQGITDGNARLAINFNPIQVKNLATGSDVTSISAAGDYKLDVNAQFLRLQGNPAATPTNVYKLLLFHSKI